MPTWYVGLACLIGALGIVWALRHAGYWTDTSSRIWREHRRSGRTPNRD